MLKKEIARLHYISQDIPEYSHVELIGKALEGGAKWIQLRIKNKPYQELKSIALEVQCLCKEYKAVLILNDYLELVKEINADGVHLGLTDTSTKEARRILGEDKIIGGTANTIQDIIYHFKNGVDYVGIGPYKFTSTKDNLSPIVGAVGYKTIIEELKAKNVDVPLIAIGGIKEEDISILKDTGVHGVALASIINKDEQPSLKAAAILRLISNTWKN